MIITEHSTQHYASTYAGGKGFNLYRLRRAGFNVPRFNVISSSVFRSFLDGNGIQENIHQIVNSNRTPAEVHTLVSDLIISASLPEKILALAKKAYQGIDSKLIAVRSSAIGEDSAALSFAGQLSSFLGEPRLTESRHLL